MSRRDAPGPVELPQRLAQPALDQVARHRLADALADHEAVAIVRQRVRQGQQRHPPIAPGPPGGADPPEVGLLAQAQAPFHRRGARPLSLPILPVLPCLP